MTIYNTGRGTWLKVFSVLMFFMLTGYPSWAHVIVQELGRMSRTDAAILYLRLGYTHILPLGLDHILFVFCLFILNPKPRPVLVQATAFTVAHSITLALALYHIVSPKPGIIEPLIAASILYVSIENMMTLRLKPARITIVFLFGLIHGLGFAGTLGTLGLPQHSYLVALVMFNAGVELGQITIILASFFLLGKWLGNSPHYRRLVVMPLSLVIAVVAGVWVVERLLI
jgi:hypothetical protein